MLRVALILRGTLAVGRDPDSQRDLWCSGTPWYSDWPWQLGGSLIEGPDDQRGPDIQKGHWWWLWLSLGSLIDRVTRQSQGLCFFFASGPFRDFYEGFFLLSPESWSLAGLQPTGARNPQRWVHPSPLVTSLNLTSITIGIIQLWLDSYLIQPTQLWLDSFESESSQIWLTTQEASTNLVTSQNKSFKLHSSIPIPRRPPCHVSFPASAKHEPPDSRWPWSGVDRLGVGRGGAGRGVEPVSRWAVVVWWDGPPTDPFDLIGRHWPGVCMHKSDVSRASDSWQEPDRRVNLNLSAAATAGQGHSLPQIETPCCRVPCGPSWYGVARIPHGGSSQGADRTLGHSAAMFSPGYIKCVPFKNCNVTMSYRIFQPPY